MDSTIFSNIYWKKCFANYKKIVLVIYAVFINAYAKVKWYIKSDLSRVANLTRFLVQIGDLWTAVQDTFLFLILPLSFKFKQVLFHYWIWFSFDHLVGAVVAYGTAVLEVSGPNVLLDNLQKSVWKIVCVFF